MPRPRAVATLELMLRIAIVASVLFPAALGTAPAPKDAGQDQDGASACVRFWGEARYRAYGYDHVVHIDNGCESRARCEVSTDVNPSVIEVTVPSKEEVEVTTYRGSPAREFVPKVLCKLEAD